jgi:adenylate kinase
MKIIILLGPPGSGKGTQAELLKKKFNLEYIGSGEVLRERKEIKDFTGKKLSKELKKGKLAPSFLVLKLLIEKLEKLKKKPKLKGLILDGWTRTIKEAELLDEALEWYQWQKNKKVILIDISEKESFERLTKRRQCKKCGKIIPWIGDFKKLKRCNECQGLLFIRADDKPEAIRERLKEFKKETRPVIDYYQRQGKLIRINGQQSIEKVFEEILLNVH